MEKIKVLIADHLSEDGVALLKGESGLQVDVKTVQRWILTGRVPHAAHRWDVAQILGVDEVTLWPTKCSNAIKKYSS